MNIPKKRVIKFTALRNGIGNYLVTWLKGVGAEFDYRVSPNVWDAKNFESSPNELFTARKYFKKSEWTEVHGTLTWTEQ